MAEMHPSYSVLVVELTGSDGALFTTCPRFEEGNQAEARSALYSVEGGRTSMFGVDNAAIGSWDAAYRWISRLQASLLHLQLIVVSPFAKAVVQRLSGVTRLLGYECAGPAVQLFDRVRDPVQEINEPAIMSLQDRESWTADRLDRLAGCLHVKPSMSYNKPRDLIYLRMLGIGQSL